MYVKYIAPPHSHIYTLKLYILYIIRHKIYQFQRISLPFQRTSTSIRVTTDIVRSDSVCNRATYAIIS